MVFSVNENGIDLNRFVERNRQRRQAAQEGSSGLLEQAIQRKRMAEMQPVGDVDALPDPDGFDQAASDASGGSYEEVFNRQLRKMIAASGGKISITSGKRSSQKQAQLYAAAVKKYGKANAGKWAAPPGRSNHEFGLAADLKFADAGARKWAHQNAAKFGLAFPMSHEPWHVELPNAKALRGKKAGGGHSHSHGAPAKRSGGGWTGDPDLDWIISKESGGKTSAKNPRSSAFGLGQLIAANRRAYGQRLGFNPDTTDFNQQLAMMREYIRERYGNARAARQFWERKGWY